MLDAVQHFLQFADERHRLVGEGEVPDREWDGRSDRLRDRWTNTARIGRHRQARSAEPGLGHAHPCQKRPSRHLEPLADEPCGELYMTSGHYHRLADDDRVWWLPSASPRKGQGCGLTMRRRSSATLRWSPRALWHVANTYARAKADPAAAAAPSGLGRRHAPQQVDCRQARAHEVRQRNAEGDRRQTRNGGWAAGAGRGAPPIRAPGRPVGRGQRGFLSWSRVCDAGRSERTCRRRSGR